jgi:GNAT superfamily N-acetyltransferase
MGGVTDPLARFHDQVRLRRREDEPVLGIVRDTDGPVVRRYPETPGTSWASCECPNGLGDDPDAWIARQVVFFSERGEQVEWKTYGYDEPADLGERLVRAGFVAEEVEALVLGESAALVHDVELPPGIRLREVDAGDEDAFRRIHRLWCRVWSPDLDTTGCEAAWETSHAARLLQEKELSGDDLVIVLAEEATGPDVGEALCAAWLRFAPGTDFASLWGGSTHPDWRRRGLYRATVDRRARIAVERGYPLIRVDCSPDSRPILTALGLRAVATTTPYVLPVAAPSP